jgi:hypothetical protein
MSQERSPEAERILMRLRASAEPAPGVADRVLAGVEQRIALGGGLASGAGPAGREISAVVPRVSGGRHAWQVVGRLGRWGAFGLLAGAIGYQLGSRAHEPAGAGAVTTAPMAAPASAFSSTPAVAASAINSDGTAVSPLPAEVVTITPATSRSGAPSELARPAAARSASMPSGAGASGASRTGRKAGATRASKPAVSSAAPLDLAAVLERLQRAQARLRDGDAHASLGELDALDALEHGGVLVDERLVLRALALCDIGRVGDARHVLAELERLGAGSIYRGRLAQGCSAALEP